MAFCDDSDVEICIESNGKIYETTKISRPDVYQVFSEDLNSDMVGFEIKLPHRITSYSLVLVNKKLKIIYR